MTLFRLKTTVLLNAETVADASATVGLDYSYSNAITKTICVDQPVGSSIEVYAVFNELSYTQLTGDRQAIAVTTREVLLSTIVGVANTTATNITGVYPALKVVKKGTGSATVILAG
jgi:hypothetical protein